MKEQTSTIEPLTNHIPREHMIEKQLAISKLSLASVSKRVQWEAFHMEISFIHTQISVHLHVNKTNIHMKGFALGISLKQRRKATRKSTDIMQLIGHENVQSITNCSSVNFEQQKKR